LILKSLILQNFRSYGDVPTRIELEPGVLFFEGDIGSGKSTILYAIEFALFGLGELDAKSLLRVSSESARVELVFSAGERDYKVIRTIEKKKSAAKSSQMVTRGFLQEQDGKEIELSPTELKTKILEILKFRENPGRSSSRIFRFAVFTPQELMREVLSQKPDERIETLRRAFGIEDYSFAASNAEIVLSRLEKEAYAYSKASQNLADKERELSLKKSSLESHERRMKEEEEALSKMENEMNQISLDLKEFDKERERVLQLAPLIEEMQKGVSSYEAQLRDAKSTKARYSKELEEIETLESSTFPILRSQFETYSTSRERLKALESVLDESRSIESRISVLRESILIEEKNLKESLKSLEKEASEFEDGMKTFAKGLEEVRQLEQTAAKLRIEVATLAEVQSELEKVSSQIGSTKATLSEKRREFQDTSAKFATIDGLSGVSECPLCRQKLTAEHLGIVVSEFKERMNLLSQEIEKLDSELRELTGRARSLEQRRELLLRSQQELVAIENRIAEVQKVSLLAQRASEELKARKNKIESLRASLLSRDFVQEEEEELALLEAKRNSLKASLEEYSKLREKIRRLEDAQIQKAFHTAESKISKKSEVLESLLEEDRRISRLEEELLQRRKEIEEKKREIEDAQPKLLEYAKLKEKLEDLNQRFLEAKSSFDRLSAIVKIEREQVSSLENEVLELKEKANKARYYRAISSWLSDRFLPAIRDVESHVLSTINEEFDQVFQRWFSMLVEEGDIAVSVDDRFTPLVEESGYELDIQSLSGGERTAVALAYRLSLNHMVKRANEAMQTSLLILDEPTEGFSKEQIYRLRGVLQEVDCDQVIIVSHERDLESLADRVYRVEKIGGESVVNVLSV
jgi:exonuclease SbcC